MHYSINPNDIKIEIEKLEHVVTNTWNIKQQRTKLPLSVFFVDLKPVPNNKDIFNVYYVQQCKANFKLHKTQKEYCSMCKLPKIWAHQKM
jgi:hypothetical protein